MLTGLTAKTLPDYPYSVFYVDKDDRLILEIEKQYAWVRYSDFWNVLSNVFKLKYDEIQSLIGRMLEKTLKTKGVTVADGTPVEPYMLEKTLKTKGVTVLRALCLPVSGLEKTLKTKGVTAEKQRSAPVNKEVVSDLKKEVKKTKQLLKRVKKVKSEIDIDSKRIKKFLSETTGANYEFLTAMIDMRKAINSLIRNYNLSKDEVCERFGVSKRKYNDFILGNYEYDLQIMATVNALFCEYEAKRIEENAPFRHPKTEEK
jgi:hypothetical protein